MAARVALVTLTLVALCAALKIPAPSWSRREQLALSGKMGVATLFAPLHVHAAVSEGGVSWNLQLPETFAVKERLASTVRIKLNTMLQAEDAATGATVKLLQLPLGLQARASLDGDEQFAVAKHFFDAKVAPDGPAIVAKTMTTSASRSPSIVELKQVGDAKGYEADDGARYVRYGYTQARCSDEIYDGECLGTLSKKRTLAMVSMSSVSQYRTNTEKARMAELGQERNVQVLWLLTLTAPEASWAKVEPTFEGIAASFTVPIKPAS